nr:hypothetical protein [Gammaproteobacteria bacterium]
DLRQYTLARQRAQERGGLRHLHEEALAALTVFADPDTALRLAATLWESQRTPRDARLLLSAALAAGEPAAAATVVEWIRQSGLQDATIDALVRRLGFDGKGVNRDV